MKTENFIETQLYKAKIILETELIIDFINNWQAKNNYDPEALNEYNAKFKKELNVFLDKNDFTKETKEIFKY